MMSGRLFSVVIAGILLTVACHAQTREPGTPPAAATVIDFFDTL